MYGMFIITDDDLMAEKFVGSLWGEKVKHS